VDLLKQLRQRRAWLRGLVVWWVALALTATALWPQSGGEYEVKAAFLYKFASFVEWPEATRHEPLGICVVGQDPFGSALERAVKGHTIGGREFVVRRLKAWRAGAGCHILFIAASEKPRLRSLLEQVQHQAILTVGDVPGFCESGGAINLSVVEARVKLEINPDATAKSGLQVSSKLLSLARTVHDPASAADGVRD
jgi:hypothetical protein